GRGPPRNSANNSSARRRSQSLRVTRGAYRNARSSFRRSSKFFLYSLSSVVITVVYASGRPSFFATSRTLDSPRVHSTSITLRSSRPSAERDAPSLLEKMDFVKIAIRLSHQSPLPAAFFQNAANRFYPPHSLIENQNLRCAARLANPFTPNPFAPI